jgi:RNA polymerase sigma factor (sigma-70 family)
MCQNAPLGLFCIFELLAPRSQLARLIETIDFKSGISGHFRACLICRTSEVLKEHPTPTALRAGRMGVRESFSAYFTPPAGIIGLGRALAMHDHFNPTRMTDGQLAAAFVSGAEREAAFRELVRRHAGMVLRTCHRITGNAQDAEDAAQLVFAALANRAGELASSRSLGGWLYSTAWHISRRHCRSRHLLRQREGDALRPGPTDLNGHVDEGILHELYRAIEMLPAEYCEAIVLHHLQGLTIKEVSELMGCAPGTTAARLSRGRAMMRERLLWRGLLITAAALEAALLAELHRRTDIARWVAESALSLESTASASSSTSTAHAGGAGAAGGAAVVACEAGMAIGSAFSQTRTSAAAASDLLAASATRKWICAACIALISVTTLEAAPAFFHAAGSLFQTHMSVTGSASAESAAAGMSNTPSYPETASSSGATSSVPEPTGIALLTIGASALLRRRRR